MSDPQPEDLRAENERLRAENRALRAEIDRLRTELERLGRYLIRPPAAAATADERDAEIGWAYQRDDLEDDLGDD